MRKRRDVGQTKAEGSHGSSGELRGRGAFLLLAILLIGVVAFGIVITRTKPANPAASSSTAQPMPSPVYAANKPAQEYVYAGGKLVAVTRPANSSMDLAVWRPSTGVWWIIDTAFNVTAETLGEEGDIPAQADFDGDDKTDVCVYRPTEGKWYMLLTGSGNTLAVYGFGLNGDKPVPADYKGDRKAEIAVFRPSNNTWYLQDTTQGYLGSVQWGTSGDEAVPADYS